ncbi:hypothetical protein AB0G05_26775 [Nonomuraea wenchangensis]|uniref:hypothetical protein n=1 Tax=Nonomuraea bangladeshensis TaxID=404385 RepID=UPI00348968BB
MSYRDHYTQAAAERLAAALDLDLDAVRQRTTELGNALGALDDEPGTWQTGELLLLALDGLLTDRAAATAPNERTR